MLSLDPRPVSPGFFARNLPLLATMLRRGWLGWVILCTTYLGLAFCLIQRNVAMDAVAVIGATVLSTVTIGGLLRYSQFMTSETSLSLGQSVERATTAIWESVTGLRFQITLLMSGALATFSTVWLVGHFDTSVYSGSLLTTIVLICTIGASPAISSQTLLQQALGVGFVPALTLHTRGQALNGWVRAGLVALTTAPGALAAFVLGPFGMLPSLLLVPLTWLFFREVYLGETGLPQSKPVSAPTSSAQGQSA